MAKRIPIGVDNFEKLVDPYRNFLFVDKTLMIKEFIDSGIEVSLITRPRRWGKTLNMSMLQHFFAIEVNGVSTKGMFDNLKIAREGNGSYLTHQGNYPVILISFKDIKPGSWNTFLEAITQLMAFTYAEHEKVILESPKLTESQKVVFQIILKGEANQSQLIN